ncbi:MAG: hypothetical protein AAEJ04_00070 [Planctomycetota bacterium]
MSQVENSSVEDLPGSGDDPSAIPTWYGGIAGTVFFLFSVYLLVFLSDREQEIAFERSIRNESRWLNQVEEKQQSQIDSYTWTDRDNKRVSVPLDQGRQEVLRRFGNTEER